MKELLYYWGDIIEVKCTFADADRTEMAFRLEHRSSYFERSFVAVYALYSKAGRPRRWHTLDSLILGWSVATKGRIPTDLNWAMVPWPPHVPIRDLLTKAIERAAARKSLPDGLPEAPLANVTPVRACVAGRHLAEGLFVALAWYLSHGYDLDEICGVDLQQRGEAEGNQAARPPSSLRD